MSFFKTSSSPAELMKKSGLGFFGQDKRNAFREGPLAEIADYLNGREQSITISLNVAPSLSNTPSLKK